MAFLMMGDRAGGGGGGDSSFAASRGRLSEPRRMWRSVLDKNAPILLSGEETETESASPLPLLADPPWLLRKDVSPKTSPPRPTCMVWRKSPSGGLIISAVRSPLWRRRPGDTRPLSPDSFSWRFMTTEPGGCSPRKDPNRNQKTNLSSKFGPSPSFSKIKGQIQVCRNKRFIIDKPISVPLYDLMFRIIEEVKFSGPEGTGFSRVQLGSCWFCRSLQGSAWKQEQGIYGQERHLC